MIDKRLIFELKCWFLKLGYFVGVSVHPKNERVCFIRVMLNDGEKDIQEKLLAAFPFFNVQISTHIRETSRFIVLRCAMKGAEDVV